MKEQHIAAIRSENTLLNMMNARYEDLIKRLNAVANQARALLADKSMHGSFQGLSMRESELFDSIAESINQLDEFIRRRDLDDAAKRDAIDRNGSRSTPVQPCSA